MIELNEDVVIKQTLSSVVNKLEDLMLLNINNVKDYDKYVKVRTHIMNARRLL